MNKHSWLVLSQADARPLYLQIIEQIKHKIAAGDLQAGEELPSIRQLASDLQLSVITIKRSYMELEREGIIITRQGKASYVSNKLDLQREVQHEELDQYLEKAASVAQLLGLSKSELQRRLTSFFESKK